MARLVDLAKGVLKKVAKKIQYKAEYPGPKIDRRSRAGPSEWADSNREVLVKSSWLLGIRYDREHKHLFVRFRDGALCRYPNIELRLAKSMFKAASLGKFTWANLYRRPYDLLDPGVKKAKRPRRKKR